MEKPTFQVLQDSDDVKNGIIQLTIQYENRYATQYFLLTEWQNFKKYVNEWTPKACYEEQNYKGTPIDQITYNGNPYVSLILGNGPLNIELCFTTPRNWNEFKKIINAYSPVPNKTSTENQK